MKNKIICFIDNSTNPDKGIYYCFKDNKGNNVEHNEFCKTFLFNNTEEDSLNPILTKSRNQYLFITPHEIKLTSVLDEAPQAWDMLLVHDSIEVAEIIDLCTSDTLILYHRMPQNAEQDLVTYKGKYKYAIKSEHTAKGKYSLLFKIAKQWKYKEDGNWGFDKVEYNTIFNEIVKELINLPLEYSLEFLHTLLEEKPKCESERIKKMKEVGFDISSWDSYKSLKDKPTDDNESFKAFSNELLSMVFTE